MEKNAAAQAKAEEIQSAPMPDEEPDLSPFSAWDAEAAREREAPLQPPQHGDTGITACSRARTDPRLGSWRLTDP